MLPKCIRSFPPLVFVAALVAANPVLAEDALTLQPVAGDAGLVNVVGPRGFITQLQVVDSGTLVEQVQELRSQLIARKQQLTREVAEKQMDSGDALLSVIMPGGLLYAGYRKAAYERARQDLAEVTEDISEYSHDLDVIVAQDAAVAVARLK